MGALAQVRVVWMPEDDYQLKNAVEGGASLESLAKGAVQFSRRFNLQEIKERWTSILYDPVTSEEVSARVLELERNTSNHTSKSKLLRFGDLRDNKGSATKTKTESIRDHYYAARKRIRLENHRFVEMELADGQIYANGTNCGIEPQFNSMVGDPTSNQFSHQRLRAGLTNHGLSQAKVDGATTSCTVVTAQQLRAPELQFLPENFSADLGILPQENPQVFGEASLPVDSFQVEKMGILEDVNMCDANGVLVDPHSIFDTGDALEDFGGFLPDCGVSFGNLQFPSPLPEIPTWDTLDDISAPLAPVNDNPATQGHVAVGTALPEGGHSMDAPLHGLDAGSAESQTFIQSQGCDLRTSDSDEYLAELYDLLDDGFDVIDTDDKPPNDNLFNKGLSLLLLSSPIDAEDDQRNIMAEPLASLSSDSVQATTDGANPISLANESQHLPCSESRRPIFSLPSQCQSPTESDDFVPCVLNAEDSVVPNINDIVLPHVSVSVKDLLENRNHLKIGQKNMGRPESRTHICQQATVNSCNHTIDDFKAPNDLPKAESDIPLKASSSVPDLCQRGCPEPVIPRGSDRCINDDARCLETNGFCHNLANRLCKTPDDDAPIRRVDYKDISGQETLTHSMRTESEERMQDSDDEIPYYSDVEEMVLEMDLGPVDQDTELKEKVSKYQSNDAMKTIIRLEQAAHSHMQRAIARRGAFAVVYGRNSKHYINKSEMPSTYIANIAGGYYVKSHELLKHGLFLDHIIPRIVVLGRGTDDTYVDIDLGAKGRTQKVSRRQAVIRLEPDGKFYIKNYGKRSIYKNNVEVGTDQTVRLQSGSLIEIRRMAFIFEENPVCVRRHLRSLHKPLKPLNSCQKSCEGGL